MEFLKGFGIFVLAVIFSYIVSVSGAPFDWYLVFIGEGARSSDFFAGYAELGKLLFNLIITYAFFVTLLFTSIKRSSQYWWIGILLLPVVVFFLWVGAGSNVPLAVSFSFVAAALIGWGVGLGVRKILSQHTKTL